ncbi:microtubule-actin cross-linking factor 1, isoforms 6/7-like [Dugong dugon]
MGKPLSRPDCLRQNPTCLGKGEEEDGYIEDCYVPQRSIYDTMRINEQIDQGSKLNQTSKSTMEKMEGSTLSSNGTLGAASNVFESRAPESKKLDERIIFDALKLSSDVQKSAPVPPRRRPNAERKDNVNRRSWKSFMPPNFPEFAERMEASLSEVSEAGASDPSLQEKRESSSVLTESSGHLGHRELQSESVTLEHVPKSVGIPEVPNVKNLSGDCQDFRFQLHSESSPHEFQPLESEAAGASGSTDVMQEHSFSSATWPRTMKSLAKGGFSEKQHPLGDTACTMEMAPLSPCLSEELLDPELHILITPSLREKTESELKFEEDERWIMMEAEEEWEEEKLSERGKTFLMADEKKNSLADIFEEREQTHSVAVVEDGADCLAAALTFDHCGWIRCSDDPQPAKGHLASVPKDSLFGCSCTLSGEGAVHEIENRTAQGLEGLVSDLECIVGPVNAEQLSDTDSVQMFLELEKECLCEEGVMPLVELESQASSEGLAPFQDAENSHVISHFPEATLEKKQHVGFLNIRVKDYDTGLDCEYFNALDSSQVPNTIEFITHTDTMRNTSTVSKEECEKVPFSPQTALEFKFRHPADLESLGEMDLERLSNFDHRASLEDSLSSSITSELAKENGILSQVDCSQIEGNVEECVERVSVSSAFNYELTVVTSEPEVEVLSYGSHLLTDEIHLEGEQGTINQENNSLTSSGNMDPCKLLSMEKVCDEDGEAKELDYEAKLLKDQAPAHFHRDFPDKVSHSLQRKSSESEILSLYQLVGGLRHSRDGMETVNDTKPKLNVASSEGGQMETRDLDSLLDTFQEDHVTKANNIIPVLEKWIPIPQRSAPTAAVPTPENSVPVVAVPAPEEPAASAAAVSSPEEATAGAAIVPTPEEAAAAPVVPALEEDVPAAAVATIEKDVPAAAVATIAEDVPAAMATIEEDVAAASVATIAEDVPAAAVATIAEDVPAAVATIAEDVPAAVATIEEDVPAAAVATIEENVPAASVATIAEDVPAAVATIKEDVPAAAVVTIEEGVLVAVVTIAEDAPAAAVVTIEEDVPAAAVATMEEDDPAAMVTIAEDDPAAVATIEEDAPAAAVVTIEEGVPAAAVATIEEDVPAAAVVTIAEDDPAAVATIEEDAPAAAVVTIEEGVPAAAVATIEEDVPAAAVVTIAEDDPAAVATIEEDAPAAAVATMEEDGPAAAVATIEEDDPAAAVATIEEDDPAAAVATTEEGVPAAAVATIEEDDPAAAVATIAEADPAAAVATIEEDDPAAAVATIEEGVPAAAVVTIAEDDPAAAVSAPKGAPASAVAVSAVEGTIPVAAVSSPEGTVPAATVSIPEEDVPAVAEPSPEGTAATATVSTIEEDDTPERLFTPAAAVPTPERPATPAVGMPAPEEDDTPATALPAPENTPEGPAAPDVGVPTPEGPAAPDVGVLTPEGPAAPAAVVHAPEEDDAPDEPDTPDEDDTPEEPDTLATAVPAPEEYNTPEGPAAPDVPLPTTEEPAAPAAAVPAMEEVVPSGVPSMGDTAHTDSVPVSEERIPVKVKASPAGMWIKEDLDSPAFGVKEMTGTVLHGQVPLTATDGLRSNEVIVAHFVVGRGMGIKVRFASSLTW